LSRQRAAHNAAECTLHRTPTVRAVRRAIQLLYRLGHHSVGLPLTEMSEALRMSAATALRLLRTLMALDVVSKDDDYGRYAFNPTAWLRPNLAAQGMLNLLSRTQATLEGLASSSGGTAEVLLLDETRNRTVVAMLATPQTPIQIGARVSVYLPLESSAGGKCILAYGYAPKKRCLQRGAFHERHDVEYTNALRKELQRIKSRGYALDLGHGAETCSAAVPLADAREVVIGAVTLTFLRRGQSDQPPGHFVPIMQTARDDVERLMREYGTNDNPEEPPSRLGESGSKYMAASVESSDSLVRSVVRAISLIRELISNPEGARLSALGRALYLHKTSTLRLLRTLQAEGLAHQVPIDGLWRFNGAAWLHFAPSLLPVSFDPAAVLVLEKLAQWTHCTAMIAVQDRSSMTTRPYLFFLPKDTPCFHPEYATHAPFHTTGAGKCFLARQSDRFTRHYIAKGLVPETEYSINSPKRLIREIEMVRQRGYATQRNESVVGVANLAVPLENSKGEMVGTIAVAPLAEELTEDNIRIWLPRLRLAAQTLSTLADRMKL